MQIDDEKVLFYSIIYLFFSSCHVSEQNETNGDVFKSESLIDLYILATSSNPIRIPFTEGAPIGKGEHAIILKNSEAERAPLMEMRQRYDDTHYNSFIPHPGFYAVYANDFIAVDLVSDTDFNDIKAGESLGGIVRLHSLSPYRWLISGSKVTYDWTQFHDDTFWPSDSPLPIKQLFPVDSYLKDLGPNDLKLLTANHTFLYFEELPVIKKHTLTLMFYEADSIISSSTQLVFQ